jgi:hypothetical protein
LGASSKWEGLVDLLCDPCSGRVLGDVEVNDAPPVVPEDHEAVEELEGHGRDHEEVDGRQGTDMVFEERLPGLRRRLARANHVLGDGRFGNIMAEEHQLGLNSRCSPERVLAAHAANKLADLRVDHWATSLAP